MLPPRGRNTDVCRRASTHFYYRWTHRLSPVTEPYGTQLSRRVDDWACRSAARAQGEHRRDDQRSLPAERTVADARADRDAAGGRSSEANGCSIRWPDGAD